MARTALSDEEIKRLVKYGRERKMNDCEIIEMVERRAEWAREDLLDRLPDADRSAITCWELINDLDGTSEIDRTAADIDAVMIARIIVLTKYWRDFPEAVQWGEEIAPIRQDRAEIDRLCQLPYNEYLATDHWREVRQACYSAAGYRCQLCNASGPIHAHHRTYERRGCELPSDVIALCEPCHAKFHDKLPKEPR